MILTEQKETKLLKRRVLGRKDVKNLKKNAGDLLNSVNTNAVSQATVIDGAIVYIFIREILLAKKNGVLFPTLTNPIIESLPTILVDMGAIPFVCNGADVMRPGITEINGDFDKNGLVIIKDEKHHKALGVGLALLASSDMKEQKKGKAVLNLHYVGDKIWNSIT
jgi:PUA domain protein